MENLSEPQDSPVEIRYAQREDVPFILQMIRELAEYEQALDEVHATEQLLEHSLFDDKTAECLIANLHGSPRGIAVFFTNFSTWEGIGGLYLEDIYVQESARRYGLGLALMKALCAIALERGYKRLDWACLEWNKPSLAFYHSLGGIAHPEWLPHRLDHDAMSRLLAR